ncbi:MAG: zf-TFIIB domain-containing protein [Armatimonadetes bacterium]|nr:zf-TFIIB domain-containing protein [Armatimonadota bacterium]
MSIQHVEVDVCGNCAGIWFDEGELMRVIKENPGQLEAIDARIAPADEQRKSAVVFRACPRCEIGLDSYRYLYTSSVTLDSCSRCGGIFVEDGELAQIADAQKTAHQSPVGDASAKAMVAYLDGKIAQTKQRTRDMTDTMALVNSPVPWWVLFW